MRIFDIKFIQQLLMSIFIDIEIFHTTNVNLFGMKIYSNCLAFHVCTTSNFCVHNYALGTTVDHLYNYLAFGNVKAKHM